MARPTKPEQLAILARRARVADLYLQGHTQAEIAAAVGVAQSGVSTDLKAIRKLWKEECAGSFAQKLHEELHRVKKLERTYWAAWERSLQGKEKSRTKKRTGGSGEMLEASVEKEAAAGHPQFLAGVERCIEQRRRLMGLDAADRTELMRVKRELKKLETELEKNGGGGC